MIKTTITTPKAISLKYGGFIGIPIDVLIIGVNIIYQPLCMFQTTYLLTYNYLSHLFLIILNKVQET